MTSPIRKFSLFDVCPKCLYEAPYLDYVEKFGPNCQNDCPECEHFHVSCRRCSFVWRMHTAETMKSVEEEVGR